MISANQLNAIEMSIPDLLACFFWGLLVMCFFFAIAVLIPGGTATPSDFNSEDIDGEIDELLSHKSI